MQSANTEKTAKLSSLAYAVSTDVPTILHLAFSTALDFMRYTVSSLKRNAKNQHERNHFNLTTNSP